MLELTPNPSQVFFNIPNVRLSMKLLDGSVLNPQVDGNYLYGQRQQISKLYT